MKAFDEWFEETFPVRDGDYTGYEGAFSRMGWKAALEWAMTESTYDRVECDTLREELGGCCQKCNMPMGSSAYLLDGKPICVRCLGPLIDGKDMQLFPKGDK